MTLARGKYFFSSSGDVFCTLMKLHSWQKSAASITQRLFLQLRSTPRFATKGPQPHLPHLVVHNPLSSHYGSFCICLVKCYISVAFKTESSCCLMNPLSKFPVKLLATSRSLTRENQGLLRKLSLMAPFVKICSINTFDLKKQKP